MNLAKKNKWMLLLLCIFLSALTGCKQEPVTKTGFYFDTIIQITLYDNKKESLIDDCFQMAADFEQLVSRTSEGSEIYELNHASGATVPVSKDTQTLLETGLYYCNLSHGSFDITIGGLSELWDFKNNPGRVPTQAQIDDILSGIGYEYISIDQTGISFKNPHTQVDLGAIAKGYIADRMKEYLNQNGISEGIINLGGNVLVLGPKSDGSPYTIGIQRPFSEEGTLMFSVEITDGTVVTSGIYERYFEKGGTIYHHILDPATGYPYQNHLLSVTILCPNSIDGDALSTTCFSLGQTEGLALVEKLPDTEAVFITEDYELITSSGIGTTIPCRMME